MGGRCDTALRGILVCEGVLESLSLPKYPELQIRGGTEQQIIFWVIGYLTHQNNVNCVNTSQNLINRVKTGDVRVMILSVIIPSHNKVVEGI